MRFDRTVVQFSSYEPCEDGEYIGLIVGFAYIGMHDTKDYGPKPKVMLRWELHDGRGPYVDDNNLVHTVTQDFPATIRGDSSWLYKALVAHGISVKEGDQTESKDWYGRAALLTIETITAVSGKSYSNVTEIKPVGTPVTIQPTLRFEHWEPEDTAPPPGWAKHKIERSSDIYQRAMIAGTGARRQPQQAPAQNRAPASHPTGNTGQASRHAPTPEYDDDEDIPF